MNFSTDGFNERNIYIHNSNDRNNMKNRSFDNSFAKMRVEENRPNVKTSSNSRDIFGNIRSDNSNFDLKTNNAKIVRTSLNNCSKNIFNKNLFKK